MSCDCECMPATRGPVVCHRVGGSSRVSLVVCIARAFACQLRTLSVNSSAAAYERIFTTSRRTRPSYSCCQTPSVDRTRGTCRHMDLKERVRGCTTGDVQAGAQTTETTPICAPLSPLVQPHSDVLPRANVCHHHMPISVYEPSGLHSNNAYYSESSAPHSLDSVLPLDSLDDSATGGAAV